ncbi:MAG: hypothetical protein J7497_14365, partial [Chitinophagaceae bacterium]|nr:hypothetical protein [Chitinophagaceae bacterium]
APAPDPVHKILDAANLMGFIASPKTTGFSGNRILRRFFKTILLAGCVHLLLKDHRNKDRFAALDQKTVTPA